MNPLMLGSLKTVRGRREDLSLRVMQAASVAAAAARQKLERCESAEQAIKSDIVANRNHPYRQAQLRQARMLEVHRSRARVELLAEKLQVAQGETRAANAALQEREARRTEALRDYLLARARHTNVSEQLRDALHKQQDTRERGELEAAQERGLNTASTRALMSVSRGVHARGTLRKPEYV